MKNTTRSSVFRFLRLPLAVVCFVLACHVVQFQASAHTIAQCGKGWLEEHNGHLILHLKGTPQEMGMQHGSLLKDHVRQNVDNLVKYLKGKVIFDWGPIKITPYSAIKAIISHQRKYVDTKYFTEIEALATSAEIGIEELQVCNFIPELMHCSGFAIMNSATADGTLYHGRVLDYATSWGLQQYAVLIVAEPDDGIPFVNVSYAGFIGSVTGMNLQCVSIGEMGGQGYGHWDGTPMALLVREAIQSASNIEQAVEVFRSNRRTCEYFFVISDGKSNQAVGMEASHNKFTLIHPGESNSLLPHAIEDCVLLSAGKRYKKLVTRTRKAFGTFDESSAIRLMDRPVSMKSNLHNVLFEPKSTRFWVAHASKDGKPAAEQHYQEFSLAELLKREPDPQEEAPQTQCMIAR